MSYDADILNLVRAANPDNPLSYVQAIVKPLAREKMDNYIASCKDCQSCSSIRSITYGELSAKIMIVGSSVLISQQGTLVYPFCGTPEGKLLNQILNDCRVDPKELFWINAVNCLPAKIVNGKTLIRTPTKMEISKCSAYLNYAIDVIQPLVIILLGSIAFNAFQTSALMKVRGKLFDIKGIPAMPTFHPGYLLTLQTQDSGIYQNRRKEMTCDIRNALAVVKKNYPAF